MDCLTAIARRHSYRGPYLPDPVAREDMRQIMQAGLDAPSGCNAQTTRLIGLDDPALVTALGGLLRKPNFASAPAAIVVVTKAEIVYDNKTFYIQDYSAAIENMLLAIVALGYASCWVEGYVTDDAQVGREMAEALGVPEGYEVVAYLPVGRPAGDARRAEKKPFDQRAWFNGFERA